MGYRWHMLPEVERPKVPILVVLIVAIALGVILLLLAQSAVSIFLGLVRTVIILFGFVAIGFVGLWLWRRGS